MTVSARETIWKVEKNCNECKKRKAKLAKQILAPLTVLRFKEPLWAFTKIGLDFTGPLITKEGWGKKLTKRHVCLLTCLLCRAVHLEIAYGVDTNSFLNAFYRMVNRRALPLEVLSDNGTNIVGGNTGLKKLINNLEKDWNVNTQQRNHVVLQCTIGTSSGRCFWNYD